MKKIEPVQIWTNGILQTGTLLNAVIINDNLLDTAIFYWSIWSEDADNKPVLSLSEGNLTIKEPEYSIWSDTSDINLAAYQWICDQLGLTLI